MAKKNTTKPVIAPAKTAPVKTAPVTRSRETVLISTTPAKLAKLVGEDTTVLVSRKQLRNLITKAASAKALDDL